MKPAKDSKSKLEDTGSQDLLNVRVPKLEDQLEKMENIVNNKEQNTVFQEDLITQIVDSVIQDILKDLKTQQKVIKLVISSNTR